jgi:hypothetical protein
MTNTQKTVGNMNATGSSEKIKKKRENWLENCSAEIWSSEHSKKYEKLERFYT